MTQERMNMLLILMSGLVALVAFAAFLTLREAGRRDLEHRVLSVAVGIRPGANRRSTSIGGRLARMMYGLGLAVRRSTKLYSDADLAAMEGMIAAAGRNPRKVLPMILGLKVILAVMLPLAAYFYTGAVNLSAPLRLAITVFALPIGLLIPDWIMGFVRRPYTEALRRGLPDALDLLVICTEAGMGLESALDQVAREMEPSNRQISSALTMLLDELRVLPDRKVAFTNFGRRSGVDGIRRMATILGQTLQYGTPLGQALRAVAAELRRERMVRLEERAVRLPALLVFPLVFFIMPSLFIVLGGIPMLGLLDILTTMQLPK